jgi:CheY-like chemotaxis protein
MSSKAILIVDDDVDVRDAMREALQFEGHKVFTATNGIEALQFLISGNAQMIGLIILDLMMPGMTGTEFLSEIKNKYPDLQQIPVVLATARGTHVQNHQTMGVARIRKPFDLDDLCRVVDLHLKET